MGAKEGAGPPRTFHKLAQMDLHNPLVRYSSAYPHPPPRQASLPVHWGQDVVRCYVIWGTGGWQTLHPALCRAVLLHGGTLPGGSSGCGELECLGGFRWDALAGLGSSPPHISFYFSSHCLSLAEDNGPGGRAETLG